MQPRERKITWKQVWNDTSSPMKAVIIAKFIVAAAVIVLAILSIAGVMENAGDIYIPLLSLMMFLQAAENWKRSKTTACVSLLAGIFILVIVLLHFFR